MTVSSARCLEDQLREILVHDLYLEVPAEEIGEDDGLQDVLGLDSLGFVELRAQCEQRFRVTIDDTLFSPKHFRSVRTVADLVRSLGGQPS
ncbi:phosphopantetheine-binding protein [Allokutzneria sp. A3M-2-11 16]|uniref:acyl carrier protein n=1 Tax=Allokutzneria sp. A3M-2-11 16 TaxID=2962043 RepID=UPI0020B8BB7D|nr:phosphopantetheine-binding protein [Allokutzneria sp. A3M-2-11 16]MCP3803428.1 phosphopantetheine-binding protein [Allokutzneria sp. A3M-2-11 16]